MQRVALVTQIKAGKEAECWRAQESLPTNDLQRMGLQGVETFIGSGYYIFAMDVEGNEFQHAFENLFNAPPMQAFLDKLRPCIESGLPSAQTRYATGDEQRTAGNSGNMGGTATRVSSAQLPLATLSMSYQQDQGLHRHTQINNDRGSTQMGGGQGSGRSSGMQTNGGAVRDGDIATPWGGSGPGQTGSSV